MKTRFYYGWVIVLMLFLIFMGTNGIGLNTFLPNFLRVFLKEFSIPIDKAAQLPAIMYFMAALPLPFVGLLLDRLNPRKLMIGGSLFCCGLLWYMCFVSSFNMVMVFCILFPLALSLCGLITSMYFINNWFVKYKGIATGILLAASSIGPALASPIVGNLISNSGWHSAAKFVAVVGSVLFIVPPLFLKNRPEDVGLYPDGIDGTPPVIPLKAKKAAIKESLLIALANYRYWLLLIVTCGMWFCIVSFIHLQGIFEKDLKLNSAQTGKFIGLFFTSSLIGKLFFGWLSDMFDKKKILLVSLVNLLSGAILLNLTINEMSWFMPAILIFGFGYGGVFTMLQLFINHLFNGPAYGTILGTFVMLDTIAGSSGVWIAGKIRQQTGDFHYVFYIYICLTLAAIFSTLLIKRPSTQKHDN